MDMELKDVPSCCKQALEQIRDKYETVGVLEEFLAVAPTLTKPMLRVSFIGVLWRIAKGAYDWRKARKSTSATLEPILRNRVKLIIDLELVKHGAQPQISQQWSRLREQLTA